MVRLSAGQSPPHRIRDQGGRFWHGDPENSEFYTVQDANGVTVAWLYCPDDSQRYSFGASKLTSDEARRIDARLLFGGSLWTSFSSAQEWSA
jgi:hypothetical protein